MYKRLSTGIIGAVLCLLLAGCGAGAETSENISAAPETTSAVQETSPDETTAEVTEAPEESSPETKTDVSGTVKTDYLAVVNKQNPLPDNWADTIETVTFTNSVDDEVVIEKKAYEAYLKFKADLEKASI